MILEKFVIQKISQGRVERKVEVSKLTKGSSFKVTRICDNCGKHETKIYREIVNSMEFCEGKQLCFKCSCATQKKKDIGSMSGKRSQELRPDIKGKYFTKECRRRAGITSTNLMKENGFYKAYSEKLKEAYRTGNKKVLPPQYPKYYYKNIRFRSTWEVKFAQYLDENNIKWQFEPKTFSLEINNSYLPDFYLEDEDLWVEIKGWWREKAKAKFNEFKETYPEERIIVIDNLNFKKFNLKK